MKRDIVMNRNKLWKNMADCLVKPSCCLVVLLLTGALWWPLAVWLGYAAAAADCWDGVASDLHSATLYTCLYSYTWTRVCMPPLKLNDLHTLYMCTMWSVALNICIRNSEPCHRFASSDTIRMSGVEASSVMLAYSEPQNSETTKVAHTSFLSE
jgi:hypothetical protein